jgi:hypothetical protein
MGGFRRFAIKQVAGDHIYEISQVLAQCKRDMSLVPKRHWAKAIVEARYNEPGEKEVRESLIEQIERHEINDFLHFMFMTLVAEGKLELSGIIQPNVKRDWQQYILDEYRKYGISINEATEIWA